MAGWGCAGAGKVWESSIGQGGAVVVMAGLGPLGMASLARVRAGHPYRVGQIYNGQSGALVGAGKVG